MSLLFFCFFTAFLLLLPTTFAANVVVVEYRPFVNNFDANVQKYEEILRNIQAPVDVVVFPEATLNTGTPFTSFANFSTPLTVTDIPCDLQTYPPYMKSFSCLARQAATFVVFNTVSREPCPGNDSEPNCAQYGNRFYNTDVIFNRNGQIVQFYRKINLFGEFPLNTPQQKVVITFFLEDSTKVSVFTCFDILFSVPAEEIWENQSDRVNLVVYPTMWFSELPFLSALQTQQMYSIAHDVVFASAGANNLALGSGGSAIFQGRFKNPKDMTISAAKTEGTATVLGKIAATYPSDEELDGIRLIQWPVVGAMASELLDINKTDYHVCHNGFCCDVHVETRPMLGFDAKKFVYTYHVMAYSGVRSYTGVWNGGEDACGVIACLDAAKESCGRRYDNSANLTAEFEFSSIRIQTKITEDVRNRMQYPNSVLHSLKPVAPLSVEWKRDVKELAEEVSIEYNLKDAQTDLLTFAVFGRYYKRDSAPGGAERGVPAVLSLLVAFILAKLV